MQIEDIAGICFASRRSAHEQGNLTIRPRVLRQVVVTDERVAAVLHEFFTDRTTGKWRDVLKRSRIGGRGGDDDGVVHRAIFFEHANGLRNLSLLLPDRHVDADDALALLIDDRVQNEGGLPGLAVADDQFTLATTDRDHRVNRLDAGLKRGINVLAQNDAGGDPLNGAGFFGLNRALAVDRLAERVHDAANEGVADRYRRNAAGCTDLVAFLDVGVLAHDDDADGVFFEVEGETERAILREFDELARHYLAEAVDAGDAVSDLNNRPNIGDGHLLLESSDLLL